jgi:hypothetical protein
MNEISKDQNVAKREWTRPELRRLEAGAAESSHNAVPDGGGGAQAS